MRPKSARIVGNGCLDRFFFANIAGDSSALRLRLSRSRPVAAVSFSIFLPIKATLAPSEASSCAVQRPRPEPPPVTIGDLPGEQSGAEDRGVTDGGVHVAKLIKLRCKVRCPCCQINADRLWQSLMDLAKIGATDKGGVRRLTLTDVDRQGRDQFVRWCKEAGLAVEVDGIGNIFAPPRRRRSRCAARRHGQPSRFAALGRQVRRRLRRHGRAGSRAHAERRGRAHARAAGGRVLDQRGRLALRAYPDGFGGFCRSFSLGKHSGKQGRRRHQRARCAEPDRLRRQRRSRTSWAPTSRRTSSRGRCWRQTKTTIGVVLGALGQRWFDVRITGQDSHAGPDAHGNAQGRAARGEPAGAGSQPHRHDLPRLRARHRGLHAGQAQFAQRRAGRSAHDGGSAECEGLHAHGDGRGPGKNHSGK